MSRTSIKKVRTESAPAYLPGEMLKKRSQFMEIARRFMKRKIAVLGLAIVLFLVIIAVFADVLAPYDFAAQDIGNRLQFPSLQHWLGTDNFGRDILTRMLYGGRTSLLVSLLGCAISVVLGAIIGAVSGYYSGRVDTLLMRLMDTLNAIPMTLLAVVISAALGTGTWQTALAVSVGGIAPTARMLRASVLSIRSQEFVEAAVAYGTKDRRLIFRHVVPNCLAPVIVDTTLRLGGNIMAISGLSFIGLGVQPPAAEWGAMLNAGRPYIRDFYPLITFPGIAILLAMLGFNLFGDGLRDALDPKQKR
jgi:peptide/nickel transport system permease protein